MTKIPEHVTAITHACGNELVHMLNARQAEPQDVLFALTELNASMLAVLLSGAGRIDDAKYREELLMLLDRGTRIALPVLVAKHVWARNHGED